MLYKAKTGLTTFILRLLVKRVLARVAVKSLLAFVAIPVNMFFNGMIGYKCIRGARVIAIGPSVAVEVMTGLIENYGALSNEMKIATIRAIATVITSVEMMHPNLRILLQFTQEKLGFHLVDPLPVEEIEGPLNEEQAEKVRRASELGPDEREMMEADAIPLSSSQVELGGTSPGIEIDILVEAEKKKGAQAGNASARNLLSSETTDTLATDGSGIEEENNEKKKMEKEDRPTFMTDSMRSLGEGEDVITARPEGGGDNVVLIRPGNPGRFLQALFDQEPKGKEFLCKVLAFSSILNGFVGKGLVKLFVRATGLSELPTDEFPLHWLTLAFIRGEIRADDVELFFDDANRENMDMRGCKHRTHFCCDRTAVCLSC